MANGGIKPQNYVFPILVFAAVLTALYMVFYFAPIEHEQGVVQKIFYFHVPSAWVAFLGFLLVFVFSFQFLVTRNKLWDGRAHAAAEIGVLFCSIVLITGPIWAKPVWGIWWTWDARLTLTLILWLIYVSYLMLRHYVVNPEKRATLSAVVGIVGFVDVPLVYFAIRWWRTQHPQPVFAGGQGSGLDPQMAATLYVCLFAFTLMSFYLFIKRARQFELQDVLDELHHKNQKTKDKKREKIITKELGCVFCRVKSTEPGKGLKRIEGMINVSKSLDNPKKRVKFITTCFGDLESLLFGAK